MVLSVTMISNRFLNGYYNLLMTKSGSKFSYLRSLYLTDVFVHLGMMVTFLAILYFGGVRPDGWWFSCLLFCLTNPLFTMCICYYYCLARRMSLTAPIVVIALISTFVYLSCI